MIDVEEERLRKTFIGNSDEVNHFMEAHGSTALSSGVSLAELIKRPEFDYESLKPLDPKRPELPYGVRETEARAHPAGKHRYGQPYQWCQPGRYFSAADLSGDVPCIEEGCKYVKKIPSLNDESIPFLKRNR